MARGSTFPLADRALGGTLERRLRRWRKEERSYDAIARLLADEGIQVTDETVRRWANDLGIKKGRAA